MKANELRIGNLIYHHYFTGVYKSPQEKEHFIVEKVVSITRELIVNDKIIVQWYLPIELTEEWLFKFGAKSYIENCFEFRFMDNFELIIFNPKTPVAISNNVTEHYCFINKIVHTIKYVHQLQNLYFALTGKELILKQ